MNKRWLWLWGLLVLLGTTGCINMETSVQVNKDGTGQIKERIGISKKAIAMMKQIAEQLTQEMEEGAQEKDKVKGEEFVLFKREDAEGKAAEFGEGVKLVSFTTGEEKDGFIYTTMLYTFQDINKVALQQSQGDSVPSQQAAQEQSKVQKKGEPITFSLTRKADGSALLLIKIPEPEPVEENAKEAPKEEAEQLPASEEDRATALRVLKAMFKGVRFAMKMAINGEIVETDAAHRQDNFITMYEVDFNQFIDSLKDPEKLEELRKRRPKSLSEARDLFEGIEGIKFETKREVSVSFN